MTQERILCAAIHYPEYDYGSECCTNVKGLVLTGFRHCDIVSLCYNLLNKTQGKMQPSKQGFLTSNERFVDRYEARQIALDAGQCNEKNVPYQLYSEDLY